MVQKQGIVVRRDERGPLNIFGDQVWFKLEGKDTDGRYSIFEDVTQPQQGPPLHRHSREDESFYVIEGEYTFEIDGKRIRASAGDSVHAPRGSTHTFQNSGSKVGRMLITVQPAGLDHFFKDLAETAAKMAEPDLKVLGEVFTKHGLDLVGPPLAASAADANVPRVEKRTPLNIFGDKVWIRLESKQTGGRYSMFELMTQPQHGPGMHRHRNEDESFYVIEGEYTFEMDGQRLHASAGDAIYAPIGSVHIFQNSDSKPGRMLITVQPGGLENYFVDLAAANMTTPDMEVIHKIFAKHGLEPLGPPLSARPTSELVHHG